MISVSDNDKDLLREIRPELLIHITGYMYDLSETLQRTSPGHPLEAGLLAAIAEGARMVREAALEDV